MREVLTESRVPRQRTFGSMRMRRKQRRGEVTRGPPDERDDNRQTRPTAIAPHSYSTGTVGSRLNQEADTRPHGSLPPNLTGEFQAARRTHSPGHQLTAAAGSLLAAHLMNRTPVGRRGGGNRKVILPKSQTQEPGVKRIGRHSRRASDGAPRPLQASRLPVNSLGSP